MCTIIKNFPLVSVTLSRNIKDLSRFMPEFIFHLHVRNSVLLM